MSKVEKKASATKRTPKPAKSEETKKEQTPAEQFSQGLDFSSPNEIEVVETKEEEKTVEKSNENPLAVKDFNEEIDNYQAENDEAHQSLIDSLEIAIEEQTKVIDKQVEIIKSQQELIEKQEQEISDLNKKLENVFSEMLEAVKDNEEPAEENPPTDIEPSINEVEAKRQAMIERRYQRREERQDPNRPQRKF